MADSNPDSPQRENVVLGMAAGMGAFLMFSIMVMFAKLLSENHSPIEIAFYRNLIAAIVIVSNILIIWRESRALNQAN